MTTSRIVRGTKGRIFIYVCAILIVTGIIACYNNTRIELENVQKSNDLCHQTQENLSTQLQVISDYKQRLEKSLKTEKAEHQQAKTELESRVNEEKLKHKKASDDATFKFNSLQQHHKILETNYDDLKEECDKKQREQLDIINNLQAKLKDVQGQLQQSERERKKSSEYFKSQIEQLKIERIHLENRIKEITKKEEVPVTIYKQNIDKKHQNSENQDTLQAPNTAQLDSVKPHYSKQVSVDGSEYKIAIDNGGNLPVSGKEANYNLNKVENEEKQIQEQVVLQSPNQQQSSSSTPNSNPKSSKASLDFVPPLKVPSMTPETVKNKTEGSSISNNPQPIPSPSKILPEGVVAVQMAPDEDKLQNSKGENDPVANLVNNRYRNVADAASDKEKSAKENNMLDIQEKENGAQEVFDVGFNEDPNINAGGRHEEQNKNHMEDNYDQFQPNDANLDENEDDDGDDYPHHHLPKEAAIRN